jgi:hypothetical protein
MFVIRDVLVFVSAPLFRRVAVIILTLSSHLPLITTAVGIEPGTFRMLG